MSEPVRIEDLTDDEKERFEERMSICIESGVDGSRAEIIALREIEDARNNKGSTR